MSRVDDNFNGYTATYEYDERGNITARNMYSYTRDDIPSDASSTTTTFTYANSGWKDQLIKVNNKELTYDANGNVLTYGNREFTWNTGRHLESVTDDKGISHYTYDENGIRTSKTFNNVTTYFNTKDGVILSQSDGTNTWYFQYDTNGSPLGFILNGTQYFYMTNQMGDVISITDETGYEIIQYEYDEWGKCLQTNTLRNNVEDIAEQNPLRYRGYYYDNETGYYYLQSRYYDPDICRFINSDIAEISQMSKDISVSNNLFAYCNNDPINNSDHTGLITPANIIGAIIGVVVGVVGGYFLSRWLADKIGLKGTKRKIFIAGITAVITAAATTIGYFIGPYVAKASKYIIESLKSLMKNKRFKSLGSTGRFTPKNLYEKLTMEQVKSNPLKYGKRLTKVVLKDKRWAASKGWVKMQAVVNTSKGKIVIHFVYNIYLNIFDDFKFK